MLSVKKILTLLLRKQTFYQLIKSLTCFLLIHVPCVNKDVKYVSKKVSIAFSLTVFITLTKTMYKMLSIISLRIKCCLNFRTHFCRPKANIRMKFHKALRNFVRTFFKAKQNFVKFCFSRNNRLSIFQ